MAPGNVEVVRGTIDAFFAGDRDRMLALVDPEIVVDATRRTLNPATYVGFDGVAQMVADMSESWSEVRFEQREFHAVGDKVAVIGKLVGKGKGSGVEVERPINGQVWTVRGGRVVRLEFGFTDRAATLEAAGFRG